MPLPPELLDELYDLYVRAAVELKQITIIEGDDLLYLKKLFGVHVADVEEIRKALVSRN